MTDFTIAESLHRLVKQAIDSGAATSISEAQQTFAGYRLTIEIDRQAAEDPVQQAILLTATALACRVFLGGVTVQGALDMPSLSPMAPGGTLAQAVETFGACVDASDFRGGCPTVVIGAQRARREGFCIRAIASGWRGGIMPVHSDLAPAPGPAVPLAGMLAAALAINEAFLSVNGAMSVAGRRVWGLSLWRPDAEADWLSAESDGPPFSTCRPTFG